MNVRILLQRPKGVYTNIKIVSRPMNVNRRHSLAGNFLNTITDMGGSVIIGFQRKNIKVKIIGVYDKRNPYNVSLVIISDNIRDSVRLNYRIYVGNKVIFIADLNYLLFYFGDGLSIVNIYVG